MTGGADGAPMTLAEVNTAFGADLTGAGKAVGAKAAATTVDPAAFKAMFKGNALPTCPFDSAASYGIEFEKLADGIGFTVYCTSAYENAANAAAGTANSSGEHGKAIA